MTEFADLLRAVQGIQLSLYMLVALAIIGLFMAFFAWMIDR